MSAKKRQRISKYNLNEYGSSGVISMPALEANVAESSSDTGNSFYLTHLPNEVLLYIYDYLTPADLVAISQIGNQRLHDLTYTIEHADFSSCHKVNPQHIISFFSRSRVKLIKKLNFDYVLYIKPLTLMQLACRCKNLTELSIVGCDVRYHHLINILDTCKNLEKLSWEISHDIQSIYGKFPNIKTVNLLINFVFPSTTFPEYLPSVYHTLENFPEVKTAWIYFAPDAIVKMPCIGTWLKMSSVTNSELTKRYIIIAHGIQSVTFNTEKYFLVKLVNLGIEPNEKFRKVSINCFRESLEKLNDDRTFLFPSCAQIKSDFEDVSLLSTESCNTVSYLSIILKPEIHNVADKLVENVAHAAGSKLKQLTVQMDATEEEKHPKPISSEMSLVICDVLDKIIYTSIYIADLNLMTVHFSDGSPFKSISKLRFLKTLLIASCSFFESNNEENENKVLDEEKVHFKDVVEKCLLVEKFSLTFCPDYCTRLQDSDLIPIKGWRDLKCLSLYCITLISCHFLRKVSESCHRLERLSLITRAPKNKCIYVPDVTYVMQNAKNLKFIQINDEGFNPMYERFWKVIGECSNLEGICLLTASQTYIERQIVLKAIQKLKYLHLFHFHSPRVTDPLIVELRKSMTRNGIVNQQIQIKHKTIPLDYPCQLHYYHKQPEFCCQHIHLRGYD